MRHILTCGSLAAAGLLLLPSLVMAAGPTQNAGAYFGVRGGLSFQDQDPGFTDTLTTVTPFFPPFFITNTTTRSGSVDTDTGFSAGFLVGYRFASFDGFTPRVETELGYLSNDVDSVASTLTTGSGIFGPPVLTTTSSTDAASGEVNAHFGMASLLIDIPVDGPFTPFFGGGIGFGQLRFDNIAPLTGVNSGITVVDDEDTVFAWSLTAGLSYALTNEINVDLSYRYLRFEDIETISNAAGGGTLISNDVSNHQINVGVRYHF